MDGLGVFLRWGIPQQKCKSMFFPVFGVQNWSIFNHCGCSVFNIVQSRDFCLFVLIYYVLSVCMFDVFAYAAKLSCTMSSVSASSSSFLEEPFSGVCMHLGCANITVHTCSECEGVLCGSCSDLHGARVCNACASPVQVGETDSNGDCMYDSVLKATKSETNVDTLRSEVADELVQNSKYHDSLDEAVEDAASKIRQGKWGDQHEIAVLADLKKLCICVWDSVDSPSKVVWLKHGSASTCIYLVRVKYNDTLHYVFLSEKGQDKAACFSLPPPTDNAVHYRAVVFRWCEAIEATINIQVAQDSALAQNFDKDASPEQKELSETKRSDSIASSDSTSSSTANSNIEVCCCYRCCCCCCFCYPFSFYVRAKSFY